jgi:hypothetical protein
MVGTGRGYKVGEVRGRRVGGRQGGLYQESQEYRGQVS